MTQIEFDEYQESLRLQIETSKEKRGGRRYLPYVFTEQGVSMLSAVLRSETAIKVSIQIIDAFVEMRKFISQNAKLFLRINNIEQKLIASDIKQLETNNKIDAILDALEEKSVKPKQGIFYDGQVFDAYLFVADLIKKAKVSILLIDNYVDESVLTLLSKRHRDAKASTYTKTSKQLALDVKKHNAQYPKITVKQFTKAHDRFLILDETTVYHFGASLKDLGKKPVVSLSAEPAWADRPGRPVESWFAFSKMEMNAKEIIEKLEKGDGDE